jgi:hypothetical protein
MPTGLRALRVVARTATYDVGVQRAMELAGEQYATLHSEALSEFTLARIPDGISEAGREEAETAEDEDMLSPGESESPEEDTGPHPNPATGTSREGASLIIAPLV